MTDTFTKAKRSWVMSRIRGRDTQPEKSVRRWLRLHRVRFRAYQRELPGNPDFVLLEQKIVVFVHGCFWHGHWCKDGRVPRSNEAYWAPKLGRNKRRDVLNRRRLRRLGWKVVVVWECQLKDERRIEARLARLLQPGR